MADSEVTLLLRAMGTGDAASGERLLELVYGELRQLAAGRMRMERQGHTLQPTALVNEAFLRLVSGDPKWQSRAHFFGAAAQAMRRILIEHARRRASQKRGGAAERVTFDDLEVASEEPTLDLLALDDALNELAESEPRLARVVELRYFVGLSVPQTAEVLGLSAATVKRDWTFARAWLFERLDGVA